MSDVREYLKAAQAAEMRGDTHQAVENLKKAAVLYRQEGKPARALQMLRQARRLDGHRQDVLDELSRYEWIPEQPMARAATAGNGEEEDLALAPLDALDTGFIVPEKRLVERGPTLADPAIPAWCSFCCRPIKEVGPLVAGPAGAFICLSCIGEARALLSKQAIKIEATDAAAEFAPQPTVRTEPPPFDTDPGEGAAHRTVTESEVPAVEAAPAPAAEAPAPPAPGLPPMVEFHGQAEAMKVLDAAMRLNARLVLILGPEGCGKTAYLRDLERRGLGHYVCDSSTAAKAPKEQRLLIDAGGQRQGQLSEADLPWLLELFGSANRQAFVAMRGEPGPPSFAVKSEDTELPMYSSNELVAATGGKLSPALASQVQVTAPFRPLTVAELTEVARRLAVGRASELDLSDELLAALADEAARSGRGGRELESLIARLPSGSWNLQPGVKPKKGRKPRKRSEPKEP